VGEIKMNFTQDELILLEICFSMNSGDTTMRDEIMPEWLESEGFSKAKTEKTFKALDKKFKEFNLNFLNVYNEEK